MSVRLEKIIAGGQTGADQGALDAAIDLSFPVGGWCPNGRRTEEGALSEKYNFLQQTPLSSYPQRTEWNIRDSSGTLITHRGSWGPGTRKTVDLCKAQKKPYLFLDIRGRVALGELINWIVDHEIQVLNVAGPRESGAPGIHDAVYGFLVRLLKFQKELST